MSKAVQRTLDSIVDLKIVITLLLACRRCNPNGDPDDGNVARTDGQGIGLMSPGCINSMIRMAIAEVLENEQAYMLTPETIFASNKEAYDALKINLKGKVSEEQIRLVQEWLCQKYIDLCWFGGVLDANETSKEEDDDEDDDDGEVVSKKKKGTIKATAGFLTAPVRFYIGESVDPVRPLRFSITRQKKTNSKRDGGNSSEMGVQQFIECGLYRVNGVVTPHFAKQTNLTYGRLLDLFACMQQMCELRQSGSKTDMRVKALHVWTYPDRLGYKDDAWETLAIQPIGSYPKDLSDYDGRIKLNEELIAERNLHHAEISRSKLDLSVFGF